MVYRVYVGKKAGQTHEADGLLREIRDFLQIDALNAVRVLNRYDVENIEEELFRYAVNTVFSEPQVDDVTYDVPHGKVVFAVEPLPGQFDQRADSAAQCIQILSQGARPAVRSAKVYVLEGELTEAHVAAIKKHVINAVESREASLELPETLAIAYAAPETVATVTGFIGMDEAGLSGLLDQLGLALYRVVTQIGFSAAYFQAAYDALGLTMLTLAQLVLCIVAMARLYQWGNYDLPSARTSYGSARRISTAVYFVLIIALCWTALLATQDAAIFAYFQF
jgi:phosphoribosylformylglycinamidine synthase